MIQQLRARQRSDEKGFTLIELMVVVLIIAILIAIAIPAFLGARKKAQDRAAQSNLRNALTAQKSIYTDAQSFTETADLLNAEEPSLNYATGANPALKNNEVWVDVNVAAANSSNQYAEVVMSAYSKSRKCYYVYETASTGTQYKVVDNVSGPENCDDAPTGGFSDNAEDGW